MSVQLSFGGQFLKSTERTTKILSVLSQTSKNVVITEQQTDDAQIQMAFYKLKLISHSLKVTPSISSLAIWCERDVYSPLVLSAGGVNVILLQDGKSRSILMNSSSIIFINKIEEIRQVLEMSIFELEKRCRMEKIMRISQMKYLENRSKQSFKQIALRYAERIQHASMKKFLSFMRFNTKWYLGRIRKCFNLWLIQTYNHKIEKTNQQIVRQEYFCKNRYKQLMQKCFKSWKCLASKPKNYAL